MADGTERSKEIELFKDIVPEVVFLELILHDKIPFSEIFNAEVRYRLQEL